MKYKNSKMNEELEWKIWEWQPILSYHGPLSHDVRVQIRDGSYIQNCLFMWQRSIIIQ